MASDSNIISLIGKLTISHPDLEARALEERIWTHDISLADNLTPDQKSYTPDVDDAIVLGAVYMMRKMDDADEKRGVKGERLMWYYSFEPRDFKEYGSRWTKWAHDVVYFEGIRLGRAPSVDEENDAILKSWIAKVHRAFWVLRHSDKVYYKNKSSDGSDGSGSGGSGASGRYNKAS